MKQIKTNVLGLPRMGQNRELKKALESFWSGKISESDLKSCGKTIKSYNWKRLSDAGVSLIPSNDFSYYDHVLDLSLTLGVIPSRYNGLKNDITNLYFAMAHGIQKEGQDVIAMEMTKWFDTNYHYIVPEFAKNQHFSLFYNKPLQEFNEALALGYKTKPVVLGPISYLLLGKFEHQHSEESACSCGCGGSHKHTNRDENLDLLSNLLPAYIELLQSLEKGGAEYVQIDEPYLALDITEKTSKAYQEAYKKIAESTTLKTIITTYFEGLGDNLDLAVSLPGYALHVDLVSDEKQVDALLKKLPADKVLSLGLVEGRNIWINDLENSANIVKKAINSLGADRVILGASCSFLHVPCDLAQETNENSLPSEVKSWLAFAWQKVNELEVVAELASAHPDAKAIEYLEANKSALSARKFSSLIHNQHVKKRLSELKPEDERRVSEYSKRAVLQHKRLNLPLYPTTTIGSFPQTKEVRAWRSLHKKGQMSDAEYKSNLQKAIKDCIEWQEEIGLDCLVHGEFERNDMVEYFGEQLAGFAFTQNGWVQSYGSRCVKPPVIFGDVSRPFPMTVEWSSYAQSLTKKHVKGMLTGPVTILKWSFVRNDQPLSETCKQIALAIRDEVSDLEKAGIAIIQIDEPAIREALPLRHAKWDEYLKWAVSSFRISSSSVSDATQIHTHMCYSEFNDIIREIADMDADVITIECSRSQMELLDVFHEFEYPNEIGPGVYDIHSARVPSVEEIVNLMEKAKKLIPAERLWVNPDCGLKTRGWEETRLSLINMVKAAVLLRK